MSAYSRQLQSAQRQYDSLSPAEPDEIEETAAWAATNAVASIKDDCPGLSSDVLREIEDWLAERIETALEARGRMYD